MTRQALAYRRRELAAQAFAFYEELSEQTAKVAQETMAAGLGAIGTALPPGIVVADLLRL